jgi:hypothetical protein
MAFLDRSAFFVARFSLPVSMVELIVHGWPAIWEEPRNNNGWRCGKCAFQEIAKTAFIGLWTVFDKRGRPST